MFKTTKREVNPVQKLPLFGGFTLVCICQFTLGVLETFLSNPTPFQLGPKYVFLGLHLRYGVYVKGAYTAYKRFFWW